MNTCIHMMERACVRVTQLHINAKHPSKPASAQDLARGQLIPPDFVKICDLKTGRERGGGVHSKRGFGVLQTLGATWLKGGAG